MSDKYNDLLLAALQRAGKPRTSGELLDDASGLALAEGWDSRQVAKLSRKSVAKRLQGMEAKGQVRAEGSAFDKEHDRMTPLFVPVEGYDPRALVPAPPSIERVLSGKPASYEGLSKTQLLAVLDAQDDLLATFAEQLRDMEQFYLRLGRVREKCRARLVAVGLE